MNTLAIDIETYSTVNLAKAGVYKYAADPDFDLLLFAYSIDGGAVNVVSLATGEKLPHEVVAALTDPTVTKYAFNAQFERVCLSQWLHQQGHLPDGGYIDPAGWRCTMVWCSALGLPRSLETAADTLGLAAQKDKAGKDLIKHFCVPVTPRATETPELFPTEGMTHRNRPTSAPEKWSDFIEYNRQDVVVEDAIRQKIQRLPLPQWVWDQYATDQRINDHGIKIDTEFARQAIEADRTYRKHCFEEARELTGLDNPGSAMQLKRWLEENGVTMSKIDKTAVTKALKTATGTVQRVLELRQEISRSSVRKYQAMLDCALDKDDRARGLIQFYGAGRTGRWAGRLIQVQNLPRNYMPDLDDARQIVRAGYHNMLEVLWDSPPDTLSQLIRTAFIPEHGRKFIVADYSAIEARVLAWLAGQQDTLAAFERGEEIYCATASMMFGVPVEKHGINGHLRDKGKVAVLACGYQGGVGAIKAMGGQRMGLNEEEMTNIVAVWRKTNHRIVSYWHDIENAVKHTIDTGETTTVRNIHISLVAGMLLITLPSGRALVYPKPGIGVNRFGKPSISFHGVGHDYRFGEQETYGGKLVENITQAVARDLLAHALGTLEDAGHKVVMHVHDEAVIETTPEATVEEICELMAQAPAWATGIPLTADGYECPYYQKD